MNSYFADDSFSVIYLTVRLRYVGSIGIKESGAFLHDHPEIHVSEFAQTDVQPKSEGLVASKGYLLPFATGGVGNP